MTEESCPKPSEPSIANGITAAKQRKKRKWDQPAESLISAGFAIPSVLPVGSMGNVSGLTTLPRMGSLYSAVLANASSSGAHVSQILQAPIMVQHANAIVQKLNHPKIQDELIAREIVINDAEPTIRYKLTKRQTQEEIQKSTGAVVITRGKYRPLSVLFDNEKPLYLHISAGAHLNSTAERVKAVDRAAAMIEEILKLGQISLPASTLTHAGGQVTHLLTACLFLGFEPDPAFNIAARICGPNDQYINHIMNETGATVILRGRGSGNVESSLDEGDQQPLHLCLSSNNPKSLEAAKLLAENLLDTISVECGASRVSSSRVYTAVPPPHQLLTGIQSSTVEQKVNGNSFASLTCSTTSPRPVAPTLSTAVPPVSCVVTVTPSAASIACPQVIASHHGGMYTYGQSCAQFPVPGGTSYNGYGGIYPQATPLQQVAQALRQAPSLATTVNALTVSAANTLLSTHSSSKASNTETDKRLPHKRKFQELPVPSKGSANVQQNLRSGSEFVKPGVSVDLSMRNISTMPLPRKMVQTDTNSMPPPPPRRSMPPPPPPPQTSMPPPPPPRLISAPFLPQGVNDKNSTGKKTKTSSVSDTLAKLVEYGEEDDDDDEESPRSNLVQPAAAKPFWAA